MRLLVIALHMVTSMTKSVKQDIWESALQEPFVSSRNLKKLRIAMNQQTSISQAWYAKRLNWNQKNLIGHYGKLVI